MQAQDSLQQLVNLQSAPPEISVLQKSELEPEFDYATEMREKAQVSLSKMQNRVKF
jgi:hypothetical protein